MNNWQTGILFYFTEVCSGGELPEVEIISLLEEQIPRYRLRADTLTEFQGEFTAIAVFFFLQSSEIW